MRSNSSCNGMACILAVLCLSISHIESGALQAQEYTGPHAIKWIRVGDLRQWFTDAGSEVEYGLIPRAQAQATQQTDEMMWEALYCRQERNCARALWIGAVNYSDPISGETYPYKVVQVGPRFANTLTNFMPVPGGFKMSGKFNHPVVIVDNMDATDNTLDDVLDEVNPTQSADRMIRNVTNTNMGITVTRTLYGFSQQNHDDYHVYDFVFKNTGLLDNKGTKTDQTLNGVIFNFVNRYSPGWEACRGGWNSTGNVGWGRNTVTEVIGQDPNTADFEMRAFYAWYSPHSLAPQGYDADWGEPDYNRPGALGAPGFCGVVTLHADKSSFDPTDDKAQPKQTQWWDIDDNIMNNIDSYDTRMMTLQYTAMNAGHPASTHAELVGNEFADLWGPGIGGTVQMLGYGPYTLVSGDSVHIVMAEGVAGIKREKSIEIGANWFNNAAPFIMPDGSMSTDKNAYKKAWVWTAEDSIYDMFRRAQNLYNNNYAIAQPPPPPETFNVNSGGDKIRLEWADNADYWPGFNGYEIFRSEGRADTIFQKIFSCDKSYVVHSFDDITAMRGFDYYYYVISKDDGSTNDIHPGIQLVSSKFWTVTNIPAYLRTSNAVEPNASHSIPNQFDLSQNYPNPFNPVTSIRYELPQSGHVVMKVFNTLGKEIATLVNQNQNAGYCTVQWDASEEVSGVYILQINTENFSKTMKMVLMR